MKKYPGLFRLSTTIQTRALANYFENKLDYTANVIAENISPVQYFINSSNKIIVFSSPIDEINFLFYLDLLKKKLTLENIDDYHLIIPLIGQGVKERHVVTFYKAVGYQEKPILFDSKINDPHHFFCSKAAFQWRKLIMGALRTFSNAYKKAEITLTNEAQTHIGYERINYINLGTQSYFDSVSCGYHALANTIDILTLLEAKHPVSQFTLSKFSKNVLNDFIIPFLEKSNMSVPIIGFYFFKQALDNTLLAGLDSEQKEKIAFKHYLLGWPNGEKVWKKVLYITLLGFFIYPFKNTLKLFFEFPVQVLASFIQYIKNKLFLWMPKTAFIQYFRSSLVLINYLFYGLVKGLGLILHAGFAIIPSILTEEKENIENDGNVRDINPLDESFEIVSEDASSQSTDYSDESELILSWKLSHLESSGEYVIDPHITFFQQKKQDEFEQTSDAQEILADLGQTDILLAPETVNISNSRTSGIQIT